MKTDRDEVYAVIELERESQPDIIKLTLSGEVGMLANYAIEALREPDDNQALRLVRKIAGVAVRCMENYGAPKR